MISDNIHSPFCHDTKQNQTIETVIYLLKKGNLYVLYAFVEIFTQKKYFRFFVKFSRADFALESQHKSTTFIYWKEIRSCVHILLQNFYRNWMLED